MRYVLSSQIKEGMSLAMPLYGPKFETLLGEGMPLNPQYISRIEKLGYAGIYIDDDISRGIAVKDIISAERRVKTVKAAKSLIQMAENGALPKNKVTREYHNKIIMPVISEIIANQHRMIDMMDMKPYGDYNYYHAANVMILSLLIGIEHGLIGPQLSELGMASLLHDVGNIFIPKSILNKPGNLTPEEFEIVKSHSQMGFEYLREHFDMTIEACMGALQHHEKYDGTGYPNRLAGNKISVYGRIITIASVYDSLTSHRPFRPAAMPPAAMDYMDGYSGSMFDPEILKALKSIAALYPAGSCVELDSGPRCIVVENYPGFPARPKLRLLDSAFEKPVYIDLRSSPRYAKAYIAEMIDV